MSKNNYDRLRVNMQAIESGFEAELDNLNDNLAKADKYPEEVDEWKKTKKDLEQNLLRIRVMMETI